MLVETFMRVGGRGPNMRAGAGSRVPQTHVFRQYQNKKTILKNEKYRTGLF